LSITTNVVSSNPDHGEVYSIQHYVIKFVSDLQQVGGFHRVLRFLSTNITDRHVESGVTHHRPVLFMPYRPQVFCFSFYCRFHNKICL